MGLMPKNEVGLGQEYSEVLDEFTLHLQEAVVFNQKSQHTQIR